MGIKGFSKTFTSRVIKQKDLKDLTGALDASVILYQSCLGMQSVKGLTDSSGTPTLHINVIIARVLNFIKGSVGQVWVFIQSLIGRNPLGAGLALAAILATVFVFAISVYAQAMKIEIPFAF